MGNGSVVVLGFEGVKDGLNIGEDDMLIFIHTVQFSDLKSEIPEGLFEPLKLVHLSPKVSSGFDPVSLLRAVNGLHALGKEKALRALREYNQLVGERDGEPDVERMRRAWIYNIDVERIFLIARLLFKRTDGVDAMPAFFPQSAHWNKEWPLYPLVVSDEVPFMVVSGYALAGAKPSAARHFDYCEQNCTLRKSPLLPTPSPIKAAEHIFASAQWRTLFPDEKDGQRARSLIHRQAIRSIEEYVAPTSDDYCAWGCASPAEEDGLWQKFRARMERAEIKWSVEKGRYVKVSP